MGLSIKTSLAYTMALLSLTGSGPMDLIGSTNIDITAIPLREYDERVEGDNAIILVDTPQEQNYYIPDTGWREREMEADEEVCTLSLATASESVADQAERFLSGQENTLNLSAGEFIVVELNGAHWVSETELTLAGDGSVEIWITDATGTNRYQSNELTRSDRVIYEERTLCTYLKIQCPEDVDSVQIQGLMVSGIPTLYQQILRELPENTVVLDERDSKNPVSIFRIPVKECFYQLADALLAGTTNMTNHEKIMVFMDFIADFYVGIDNQSKDQLSCGSYITHCGGYSHLLAVLACTQGMQARIISLDNYPQYTGHVVCEINYDDSWHVYDPTFGAYYTDTAVNQSTPSVLSYQELNAGNGNSTDITCVITTPKRIVSDESYGFLGPSIYERAFPQGIIDGKTPQYYPLLISYSDVENKIDITQFNGAYQGIQFIGVTSINYMQNWTISQLESGKCYEFIIAASYILGETEGDFDAIAEAKKAIIVSNEKHTFSNENPNSMEWHIEFIAQSDTVQIVLSHGYTGPNYHYITPVSFELREKA